MRHASLLILKRSKNIIALHKILKLSILSNSHILSAYFSQGAHWYIASLDPLAISFGDVKILLVLIKRSTLNLFRGG